MAYKLKDLKFEVLKPISYYMKDFDSTFQMGKHVHPYFEIMYCKSGSFFIDIAERTNDEKPTFVRHTISTNEFIFIDADVPHCLVTEQKSTIYNIEFLVCSQTDYNPFDVNSALRTDYSLLTRKSGLNCILNSENGYVIFSDTENVSHCLRALIKEFNEGCNSFERACIIKSRIILLFMEISKCHSNQNSSDGIIYIKRAKQYIQQNFTNDINIDEIAKNVNINKAYLQRLFKAYTDTTILKLINNYRITLCQQLLTTTNMPIEEIAQKSGFQSRQHLIYEFKKTNACSPSDYRKNYLNWQVDHRAKHHDSLWIKD
ncbi:MAG: helix-turn-helix domain-containing protein [Christensenellales bacterium]